LNAYSAYPVGVRPHYFLLRDACIFKNLCCVFILFKEKPTLMLIFQRFLIFQGDSCKMLYRGALDKVFSLRRAKTFDAIRR